MGNKGKGLSKADMDRFLEDALNVPKVHMDQTKKNNVAGTGKRDALSGIDGMFANLTPEQRAVLEGHQKTQFEDSERKRLKAEIEEERRLRRNAKAGDLYAIEQVRLLDEKKKTAAVEAQYGNDMSHTDVDNTFSYDPALLGKSKESEAYADQGAIEAQRAAVNKLFGIANGDGATAEERARMAAARGQQDQWLRSQREADSASFAERGMGGSGSELLSMMGDRQAAAQRLSQADLETQARLEQRAMDALMKGGDLAGQIRTSSFEESSQRGRAADTFSVENQRITNKVKGETASYQRDSQKEMLDRRANWEALVLQVGADKASELLGYDIRETENGYEQGGRLALADSGSKNDSSTQYRGAKIDPKTSGADKEDAANQGAITLNAQGKAETTDGLFGLAETGGKAVSGAASMGGSGDGGGGFTSWFDGGEEEDD